jgi:hypothetical protein
VKVDASLLGSFLDVPTRAAELDSLGGPDQIAPELHRRYGDVISRISFGAPSEPDRETWRSVMDGLKQL